MNKLNKEQGHRYLSAIKCKDTKLELLCGSSCLVGDLDID